MAEPGLLRRRRPPRPPRPPRPLPPTHRAARVGRDSSGAPDTTAPAHEVPGIDRIACTGYGQCAELLPELLSLDEWSHPVQHTAAVPPELHTPAVRGCPRLALSWSSRGETERGSGMILKV
ncbi:ferredoxin [Kitasatospora griseola]|uniref:ferredoxin n=1 Tax=Kitasatospora griseola TaxID=2064 RepID=UPI0035712B6D